MSMRKQRREAPPPIEPSQPTVGHQYRTNAGVGADVTTKSGEHVFSLRDEEPVMHPWTAVPYYRDPGQSKKAGAGWYVSIKPGFVNGADPLIYAEKAAGYWPLSIYKTASSALGKVGGEKNSVFWEVAKIGDTPSAGWIELARGPIVEIKGFANDRPLPEFFKRLNAFNPNVALTSGVASTAQLAAALGFEITPDGKLTQNLTNQAAIDERRACVAQDFWLEIPRAAYRTTVDIIANPLTGQLVDYNTVFDTSVFDQRGGQVRIYQGRYPRDREAQRERQGERLGGIIGSGIINEISDPGVDFVPLFTIYLLQPPVASRAKDEAGSIIDKGEINGTWQPFVQYQTHWNINHAVRNVAPYNVNFSAPVELFTAFFVGRFTLAAAALGAVTAEFDRILNVAMNQSNTGSTWTT